MSFSGDSSLGDHTFLALFNLGVSCHKVNYANENHLMGYSRGEGDLNLTFLPILIKPIAKAAIPSSIPIRAGMAMIIPVHSICSVMYFLNVHGEVSPCQPPHRPE
jgi:hypothetical protein